MIKIKPDKEGFLTQWDSNRRLQITGLEDISNTEIHFSKPDDTKGAYVVLPIIENGLAFADIPNILLTVSGRIDVFVYRDDHTCVRGVFVVAPREKPDDYVYTETEVLRYEDFVERLDALQAAMPKKLSDLENDLFYSKRVEKLSLTASDFQIIEQDGVTSYIYQCSPKVGWMTSADNFDFEAVYTVNGETVTLTKDNCDLTMDEHEPEDGLDIIVYAATESENFIVLANGIAPMTEELNDKLTITSMNMPDTLIIYGIEAKKIPFSLIDTSEIEAVVDDINGEVV